MSYFYISEEELKKQREEQKKMFESCIAEASRKQKLRDEWDKNHPPCSQCGHKKPYPDRMSLWYS